MKRYEVRIYTYYGTGYYDGEEYSDLQSNESVTGEWVKATDAIKMQQKLEHRIERMQARIDKLEGRK